MEKLFLILFDQKQPPSKKLRAIRRAFICFLSARGLVQMRSTENPSETGSLLLLNAIKLL